MGGGWAGGTFDAEKAGGATRLKQSESLLSIFHFLAVVALTAKNLRFASKSDLKNSTPPSLWFVLCFFACIHFKTPSHPSLVFLIWRAVVKVDFYLTVIFQDTLNLKVFYSFA